MAINKLNNIDKNLNLVAVRPLLSEHHAQNIVPKIFSVSWIMHTRCNFDCSYCPSWLHDNFSAYISLDLVKKTVDNFSRKIISINKENINWALSGGEPLINPDIQQILDYIKNHNTTGKVTVTSNGSVSLKILRKIIHNIDNFTLSLHMEKGLDYVIKTINKFKILQEENYANNKFFSISLLVPTGYLEQVKTVANILKDSNLKYSFRSIRPTLDQDLNLATPGMRWNKIYEKGDTEARNFRREERHQLKFSEDERFRSIYYTDEEKKFLMNEERKEDFQNMGIWDNDDNYYELHSDLLHSKFMAKFKGWSCFAGVDHCVIHSNGDVLRSICNNEPPIGNIKTDFHLKNLPMICTKNTCQALPDITCRKSRKDYEHKITSIV